MANPIFISYRRDDSEGEAGRLFDDLTREFGSQSVFMDVAGIRPGVDFVKAIETNVADCGVLLAIIGPTWATITNAHGLRRLDDPNDFVALEIASALKREVPVIPVLVHGAKMPAADQLPESLKDFSHRNSVELSHTRWPTDVQLLMEALKNYVVPSKETAPEPVHANVPVQLPPPHQPGPQTMVPPQAKRSSSVLWGFVIAGIVAVAAAVFLFSSSHHAASSAPAAAIPGLAGTWKYPLANTGDTLSSLIISGSGSNLTMHAFGSCQPALCDWGTQPAVLDGQAATATFNVPDQQGTPTKDRVASIRVGPNGPNLDVLVNNTFQAGGHARKEQIHRIFVPGP